MTLLGRCCHCASESINLKVYHAGDGQLRWNRDVGSWRIDRNGDVWGLVFREGKSPTLWISVGGSSQEISRSMFKPTAYQDKATGTQVLTRYAALTGKKLDEWETPRHLSKLIAFRSGSTEREPGTTITTDGHITQPQSILRRFYMQYGINPADGLAHYSIEPVLGRGVVGFELHINSDSVFIHRDHDALTIHDNLMETFADSIIQVTVTMPTGDWHTGFLILAVQYTDVDAAYFDQCTYYGEEDPPGPIGWRIDVPNQTVVSYGAGNKFIPGGPFEPGERQWGLTSGRWCEDGELASSQGYSTADTVTFSRHSPIVYHIIKADTSVSPWVKTWEYAVQEEGSSWSNGTLGNWGTRNLLVNGGYVRVLHDSFFDGPNGSPAQRSGIFMTQIPYDGTQRYRFTGDNIFQPGTGRTSDTAEGVVTGKQTQIWLWNYKDNLDSLQANGVGERAGYNSLQESQVLYRDGDAGVGPPLDSATPAIVHEQTAMFGGTMIGHSSSGLYYLGTDEDIVYDSSSAKVIRKGPQPTIDGVDTGADKLPASSIFPPNNQYLFHSYFYEKQANRRYSEIDWAFYITLGSLPGLITPEAQAAAFPNEPDPANGAAISDWFNETTTIEQVNASLLNTFGTVAYTNGGASSNYPVAKMVATYDMADPTFQGAAFQRNVPLEFRFSDENTLAFNPNQKTPPVWNSNQLSQTAFKVFVIAKYTRIPAQGQLGECDWNGNKLWSASTGSGTVAPSNLNAVFKNSMYLGFQSGAQNDIPIPVP